VTDVIEVSDLDAARVVGKARMLLGEQSNDRFNLDVLRRYYTGRQGLPLVIPSDAPAEVREMARISRINMIKIVVEAMVQSLFVDNIRMPERDGEDGAPPAEPEGDDPAAKVWAAWQANRLDRAQSGLYRATFQYGTGYMVGTPGRGRNGDRTPVLRPVSPRAMTTHYADSPDWPVFALERRKQEGVFRFYDTADRIYEIGYQRDRDKPDDATAGEFTVLGVISTGLPYCPIVRYLDEFDVDDADEPISHAIQARGGAVYDQTDYVAGQVAPLITLQDQADVTSFALLSAMWYTAFRQRWIVGWTPSSRTEKIRAGASQMWTFSDHPDDIRLGEFSETNMDGFLRSRESVAKYAATLSQTPVHELIGELVNLSAEALAAAEAGRDRKLNERETGLGESHEQLSQMIGDYLRIEVPDDIEVVWRDTSARAFGAIVDGLGKLAAQLQIPPQMLWDRIPGVTRQDVQRWKAAQAAGDSLDALTSMLDRQANPSALPGTGETRTQSGLILPPGAQV
jgi:hypothetical protein